MPPRQFEKPFDPFTSSGPGSNEAIEADEKEKDPEED
jgi:hypothetical protein